MDAYIVTDASFLAKTEAAGLAYKIEVGTEDISEKATVAGVNNSTHAEFIAVFAALKRLEKLKKEKQIVPSKILLATDCQAFVTLMENGLQKNRRYHNATSFLLKKIKKQIASLGIPIDVIKVKAHVENNPTPLEAIHNEVDKQAKQAMGTLMREISMIRVPGDFYTTLLPQTLLPDEYEELEAKAYELAEQGLSPRVVGKAPFDRNPFADGVRRFIQDNPDAELHLSDEFIPTFDSINLDAHPSYHRGIKGIDRIQTLDAFSRMGFVDTLLLETDEGKMLADIGRGFTGLQDKPKRFNTEQYVRAEGQSAFLLTHKGSRRMGDLFHLSMRYASLYDIPENVMSNPQAEVNKEQPQHEKLFR